MKLNIKSATKSVMTNGKEVALTVAGALVAGKFLNFDTMFAAQPPTSYMRKHQGAIKFLAATIGAGMVKSSSPLRPLLNGVALEGGLRMVRAYGGGTFFQPLGAENLMLEGADDAELNEILEGADDDLMGSITSNYQEAVAGPETDLTNNAASAVSGMPAYGSYMNGQSDGWY
jgi:hypothetical protein